MIQLIYTSVSSVPFSGAELARLLLKSRINNELAGLTGLLLYRADAFMQLLEGDEELVDECYARIVTDPRHRCVQVLRRAPIQSPTFPGWSMGFVHLEKGESQQPSGLEEFFEKKGRPTPDAGEIALRMLKNFRYGNSRRKVERGYAPIMVR